MRTSRKHSDHRKNQSKRAVYLAVHGIEALESRTLFDAPSVTILAPPTPNPYANGTAGGVQLTATVLPAGAGSVPNGGTVTFFVGSTPIGAAVPVVAGSASLLNVTTLPVGTDSITADYSGDPGNFLPSNSPPQTEVVTGSSALADTTTTVNSPTTTAPVGTNITFTATVAQVVGGGPAPTGTVTFYDGSTAISGAIAINGAGNAVFSTSTLPVGSDSITATYTGDANYNGSNSPAFIETITASTGATPSTTTISTTSPGTVNSGTPITFNASVAPVGATGTVQFMNNGSPIGAPQPVDSSGNASLTISTLPIGTDNVTAVYSGDSTYATSTSSAITETVIAGALTPTTTTVTAAPTTAASGSPVTLTANIAPGVATGTVQFFANGVAVGAPATVVTGQATLVTGALPVGTDSITAVYSGDSVYASSTSAPIIETITPFVFTPSTTTLTASPTTALQGANVTLTATVSPSAATGSVQFFVNGAAFGAAQPITSGVATLVTGALPPGSDSITAVYSGDAVFSTSTSAAITETIIATTGTTVTFAPLAPTVGNIVTLTATVAPATATGFVQFFDGATPLGTPVMLNGGTASLDVVSFAVGNHSITASYSGDATDNPSVSTAVILTEGIGTPVLTASTSSPTTTLGAPVTFTATVAPQVIGGPTATGTVTFFDGATAISGAIPLSNGVAAFVDSALTFGGHSISFTYSGDFDYSAGTSPSINETVGLATSTTTLTVSPNPAIYTQSNIVLTAHVSPTNATGTVDFFNGVNFLGSGVVVGGGVAAIAVSNLTVGTYGLSATYNGDTNYSPSTSTTVFEQVTAGPSTTTLTTSTNLVVLGNPVTLTATVTTAGVPATGTVSFFEGGTLLGTGTVTAGVAAITVTTLPVGVDSITAVYGGDVNYTPSTATASVVTVTQGLTSTTATATPSQAAFGAPITFTVTVAPLIAGNPVATGTIDLTQGSIIIATGVPLINGVATFTTTTLPLGVDSIIATYSGDSNYLTSVSQPVNVTISAVNPSTTTTTLTSSDQNLNFGDSVTFTAVVAPALASTLTPSGTVTFFDGAVALGAPVVLGGGIAYFTTAALPPGVDNITVVYNGDNNFSTSTSAPVAETVTGTTSTGAYVTTLSVSNFTATFGVPVTLTATVFPSSTGIPQPFGGTVTFFSDSQTLGAATLGSDESVTFSTPLPAGTHQITAAYSGAGPVTTSLPQTVAVSSPITPSLAKANLPPAVIEGTSFHTNLPITVTNLSAAQIKGNYTLQVYLDTSTTLDGNRVLLTTITKNNFNINGGKFKIVHAPETLPASLAGGTYYFLVDVTDPSGLTNLVASTPIIVAPPFVGLKASISATNPPNIGIGQSADVFVTVTNTGNETASGVLNLTLSPSTDGINPVTGTILGTGSIQTTIPAGQSRRYRVTLDTTALSTNSYFPYVSVGLGSITTTAVGVTPFTVG